MAGTTLNGSPTLRRTLASKSASMEENIKAAKEETSVADVSEKFRSPLQSHHQHYRCCVGGFFAISLGEVQWAPSDVCWASDRLRVFKNRT
jgi:hypothetical protein